MTKIEINTNDNICYYKDSLKSIYYVKACENKTYCHVSSSSDINACQEYHQVMNTFDGACNSDIECDGNLKCVNKKCTINEGEAAYTKTDAASRIQRYYCPSDLVPKSQTSDVTCEKKGDGFKDKYKFKASTSATSFTTVMPGLLQVEGEISFDNSHNIESIEKSYIGTVDNGKFVENMWACSSGFGIRLFWDKTDVAPSTGDTSQHYYCVTITGAEYDITEAVCKIKYSIDGNDENFYSTYMYNSDNCQNLILMKDIFKNYTDELNEKKEKCLANNYYEEPFTCRDNKMRFWWYFYNNPEEYSLYKDDEEVIQFLVQQTYKGYDPSEKEETEDISSFIKYNLFYMIIFFLI